MLLSHCSTGLNSRYAGGGGGDEDDEKRKNQIGVDDEDSNQKTEKEKEKKLNSPSTLAASIEDWLYLRAVDRYQSLQVDMSGIIHWQLEHVSETISRTRRRQSHHHHHHRRHLHGGDDDDDDVEEFGEKRQKEPRKKVRFVDDLKGGRPSSGDDSDDDDDDMDTKEPVSVDVDVGGGGVGKQKVDKGNEQRQRIEMLRRIGWKRERFQPERYQILAAVALREL